MFIFFFNQKTAYDMRISDWSSDVCSSDLGHVEITSRYRVLAFDMPWHGKSYPPEGWQDEEYRLTTELYVETILAFCNALALDKPALIGCSIGGRIVLHLANAHSDK